MEEDDTMQKLLFSFSSVIFQKTTGKNTRTYLKMSTLRCSLHTEDGLSGILPPVMQIQFGGDHFIVGTVELHLTQIDRYKNKLSINLNISHCI